MDGVACLGTTEEGRQGAPRSTSPTPRGAPAVNNYDPVSKVDSHLTGLLRKRPFPNRDNFGSGPPPGARGAGSGAAGPRRAVDAPRAVDAFLLLSARAPCGGGGVDAGGRARVPPTPPRPNHPTVPPCAAPFRQPAPAVTCEKKFAPDAADRTRDSCRLRQPVRQATSIASDSNGLRERRSRAPVQSTRRRQRSGLACEIVEERRVGQFARVQH